MFLFIYFWLLWVLFPVLRLSLTAASGLLIMVSSLMARGQGVGSVTVAHRFSCLTQTKNRTHVPCVGRQILTHCTTRQVPVCVSILSYRSWFCILQINPLSVALFTNIFSHPIGCLFFYGWKKKNFFFLNCIGSSARWLWKAWALSESEQGRWLRKDTCAEIHMRRTKHTKILGVEKTMMMLTVQQNAIIL